MKSIARTNNTKNYKFIKRQDLDEIKDVIQEQVEATNESIVAALNALREIYKVFCDVHHKVASQGVDVFAPEERFFNEGRTVQIGSFKMVFKSIKALEDTIIKFTKKLGTQ
jgi:hypothetical protein